MGRSGEISSSLKALGVHQGEARTHTPPNNNNEEDEEYYAENDQTDNEDEAGLHRRVVGGRLVLPPLSSSSLATSGNNGSGSQRSSPELTERKAPAHSSHSHPHVFFATELGGLTTISPTDTEIAGASGSVSSPASSTSVDRQLSPSNSVHSPSTESAYHFPQISKGHRWGVDQEPLAIEVPDNIPASRKRQQQSEDKKHEKHTKCRPFSRDKNLDITSGKRSVILSTVARMKTLARVCEMVLIARKPVLVFDNFGKIVCLNSDCRRLFSTCIESRGRDSGQSLRLANILLPESMTRLSKALTYLFEEQSSRPVNLNAMTDRGEDMQISIRMLRLDSDKGDLVHFAATLRRVRPESQDPSHKTAPPTSPANSDPDFVSSSRCNLQSLYVHREKENVLRRFNEIKERRQIRLAMAEDWGWVSDVDSTSSNFSSVECSPSSGSSSGTDRYSFSSYTSSSMESSPQTV